jgi:translation initiation factor IF-3
MAHPEIGHKILMRLIADLSEVAVPETQPRMEGNQMHTILTAKKGQKPKPAVAPRPVAAGEPERT